MRQAIKDRITGEVRSLFNDASRGEAPVARSKDGLFGPDSVSWKVHGDVVTMMVGGIAALLMQMLHPSVLAGVWDHSNFREDMLGRLRRTARFIALTTYGSRAQAEQAIARVREVHEGIVGTTPAGAAYAAGDADLLTWVHATETHCFLKAWIRYAEPAMPLAQQNRYFAETYEIARRLGAADAPLTRAENAAYIASMRPHLKADERTREIASLILRPSTRSLKYLPLQQLTSQAAVDLLPRWARRLHGLHSSGPGRPIVQAGAASAAGLLRWAFR